MNTRWTPYFQRQLEDMLACLKTCVEMESPTHDKRAVDRLGGWVAERFSALGCRVDTIAQSEYGDQLRVEYGEGDEQILILGHIDTVKPVGTLAAEPCRIEACRMYGPGVYDMKAGVVMSYFALRAIAEHRLPLGKKLVFFWNTDEEAGSPSSSRWIREEAKRSALALVVEPAAGDGALKTSRKGGGEFRLRVRGRAAHAGNDHARGINAIEELAHHILAIQSWTDYEKGTTLSVGLVQGGSASNVVPAEAEAVIDVRVARAAEAAAITRRMRALTPVLAGANLTVEGGIEKLPMERTAETERLFRLAQAEAEQEGMSLRETGAGGTSDGNIAAAVGTPVLDGLGPVGDGAHAPHEHILVDALPFRTALLTRLLARL